MMSLTMTARRALRGVAAALVTAGMLAACGGSTSRVDQFVPSRLIVFGDEYSTLVDRDNNGNGYNYAMNGLDASDTTNGTLQCRSTNQLIWVQMLAAQFGLVFKECNPEGLSDESLRAYMEARFGATVRAVEDQVSAFQSNIIHDPLNGNDLTTVLVGVEDIVQIYSDNLVLTSQSEKLAEAEARGNRLGVLVNQIANAGPRVLISQLFDVGLTPWALSQGSSEAKFITSLSDAFNKGLRLALNNDGTKIGLISLNDIVANQVRYGGYNNADLACNEEHVETVTAADANDDGYVEGGENLVTCTTATISSDNAAGGNLWADSLRFTARIIHKQLGNSAISRAVNNPF